MIIFLYICIAFFQIYVIFKNVLYFWFSLGRRYSKYVFINVPKIIFQKNLKLAKLVAGVHLNFCSKLALTSRL
jgi:hypothetical protein